MPLVGIFFKKYFSHYFSPLTFNFLPNFVNVNCLSQHGCKEQKWNFQKRGNAWVTFPQVRFIFEGSPFFPLFFRVSPIKQNPLFPMSYSSLSRRLRASFRKNASATFEFYSNLWLFFRLLDRIMSWPRIGCPANMSAVWVLVLAAILYNYAAGLILGKLSPYSKINNVAGSACEQLYFEWLVAQKNPRSRRWLPLNI